MSEWTWLQSITESPPLRELSLRLMFTLQHFLWQGALIGMGAGLHYGSAGPTHHAIEDVALLRSLPHMTIISPCSPSETACAVKAAVDHSGPVYIRMSRTDEKRDFYQKEKFQIGQAVVIEQGKDATLISTGSVLTNVQKAVQNLKSQGLSIRLIHLHTLKQQLARAEFIHL